MVLEQIRLLLTLSSEAHCRWGVSKMIYNGRKRKKSFQRSLYKQNLKDGSKTKFNMSNLLKCLLIFIMQHPYKPLWNNFISDEIFVLHFLHTL